VIPQHPKEPVRQIARMGWGLVPHWAKDASGSVRTINARSETAATKPAFRDPLKFRRCLIPADGFYEWKRTGTVKQPYCFEVNEAQAPAHIAQGFVRGVEHEFGQVAAITARHAFEGFQLHMFDA
jgi:putative SOS response-associated peptidase YedK